MGPDEQDAAGAFRQVIVCVPGDKPAVVQRFQQEFRRSSCQCEYISEGQYRAENTAILKPGGSPRSMWRFLFDCEDSTYWIQDVDSGKYIARSSDGTEVVWLDTPESQGCKWRLQDGGEGAAHGQGHRVDDEQSGQQDIDLGEGHAVYAIEGLDNNVYLVGSARAPDPDGLNLRREGSLSRWRLHPAERLQHTLQLGVGGSGPPGRTPTPMDFPRGGRTRRGLFPV